MTLPFAKELSLSDIMRHLGAVEPRLRCLIEGEEVLNARHIICCGVKTCSDTSLTVQGLCVQTSHVQHKPHELEFVYGLDGTIKGHCTCEAGNSERCKHLVAMMLLVNRQDWYSQLGTPDMYRFKASMGEAAGISNV
ncbi:hypothetical protein HPB52_000810 [Rhipicephalus sanguineus]|uniref:SWIM-type domain-containing protein n=1 Tax=Rhipicephalus sanguineus TaxID=34632 RepID=A0A9D4SX38_RHISA|nr:hypothetical protein HPB52_000810 [Rhipicephalus sanguineus]